MLPCCGAGPDRVECCRLASLPVLPVNRTVGWDGHETSRAQCRARNNAGADRRRRRVRGPPGQSPGCLIPMTAARIRIREPYRVFRDQLAELPGTMCRRGVTLHSGRNLIKRLSITSPEGESIEVVVKAFAVPMRLRGFVYAHLRRSKALRCMSNATSLVEKGVGTPDPIACIEYHDFGCLRRSHYVSRYWHHDHDLTALLYRGVAHGPATHALLEQLAQFTAVQHDHGVLHLDLQPGKHSRQSKWRRFRLFARRPQSSSLQATRHERSNFGTGSSNHYRGLPASHRSALCDAMRIESG